MSTHALFSLNHFCSEATNIRALTYPVRLSYALRPRCPTIPQSCHGTQPEPRMNLSAVKRSLQKNSATHIKSFGNTFRFIKPRCAISVDLINLTVNAESFRPFNETWIRAQIKQSIQRLRRRVAKRQLILQQIVQRVAAFQRSVDEHQLGRRQLDHATTSPDRKMAKFQTSDHHQLLADLRNLQESSSTARQAFHAFQRMRHHLRHFEFDLGRS